MNYSQWSFNPHPKKVETDKVDDQIQAMLDDQQGSDREKKYLAIDNIIVGVSNPYSK